jgi:hypothetical protein
MENAASLVPFSGSFKPELRVRRAPALIGKTDQFAPIDREEFKLLANFGTSSFGTSAAFHPEAGGIVGAGPHRLRGALARRS